ncbi:hypothetical protein C2E23DRAFT_853427 [Lenzites betulinus]|nr:hypothetical protein C2E23DRAFT_853427 [Lenzites betulinus]
MGPSWDALSISALIRTHPSPSSCHARTAKGCSASWKSALVTQPALAELMLCPYPRLSGWMYRKAIGALCRTSISTTGSRYLPQSPKSDSVLGAVLCLLTDPGCQRVP